MYVVARPALRSSLLARRPAARIIHGRRYPQTYRVQSFHSTRWLLEHTPNPDNTPVSENDAANNKTKRGENAAETEQLDVPEDQDVLAQKLQRSREMTRRYSSALRRTQRHNRAQDLPPICIPDWFLEKRVRIRENNAPLPKQNGPAANTRDYEVSLNHPESGEHAAVRMSASTNEDAAKAVSQLMNTLWGKGLSEEHMRLLAENEVQGFAQSLGYENDDQLAEALKRDDPRLIEMLEKHGDRFAVYERAIEKSLESELREAAHGREVDKGASERMAFGAKAAMLRYKIVKNQRNHWRRISPLLLAEIRTTIAASLSAVEPSVNHSFPSTKTNLILHCPSNRQEKTLNSAVQLVASELGADVVTLQAQDLAQLAGDYLGDASGPSPHSIRSLGYETYKYGQNFMDELEVFTKDDAMQDEQDAAMPFPTPGGQMDRGRPNPSLVKLHFVFKSLAGLKDATQGGQQQPVFAENNSGSSNATSGRPQTQNDIQLEDLKLMALLEALVDADELKRSKSATEKKGNEATEVPTPPEGQAADEPKLFEYSFQNPGESLDATSQPLHAKELTFTVDEVPLGPPFLTFTPDPVPNAKDGLTFTVNEPSSEPVQIQSRPKIIHVKDIKELNSTQYGSRIIQKLEEIVRKQRKAGESVMIIGTTCSEDLTPEMSAGGVQSLQSEGLDGFFRTIVVVPGQLGPEDVKLDPLSAAKAHPSKFLSRAEKSKYLSINVRHIHDMLQCLDPKSTANLTDMKLNAEGFQRFRSTFSDSYIYPVLTYDEVHRVALTALGLRVLDSSTTQLNWAHVTLAMGLLRASDAVKHAYVKTKAAQPHPMRAVADTLRAFPGGDIPSKNSKSTPEWDAAHSKRQQDISRIKATASAHEKKLMHGIIDPSQIKTTFSNIHVPAETITAIRTLTSLSLLRPDAFDYGILANEKISGALLYGPPGTGKTLLAKAVAKESGSTVLEVSGSSIMDKYVGEGEKNVAAIFSLARKLSPCIVFLDEADAIFGTRDSSSERTSHRDILNQFLKEWDGLNDMSVFVMVATNRPFDMDDAVIRRLPRRLLVDLPTMEDRKAILKIHLKGEQLGAGVDLEDLAKRTPLYSGSDLKNVAVFAALAAVREENEEAALAAAKEASRVATEGEGKVEVKEAIDVLVSKLEPDGPTPASPSQTAALASSSPSPASAHTSSSTTSPATPSTPSTPPWTTNMFSPSGFPSPPHTPSSSTITPTPTPILTAGTTYSFPARRTLQPHHFEKALQEVSASISENMSSLNAIKKFDEQYGDRKGRRRKTYGFGVGGESAGKEGAGRVRP